MSVEHEGKSFRTHAEKDKFLKEREQRRKMNLNAFKNCNEFNFKQASFTEAGVWACSDGGTRGTAKFHQFNDPNFQSNIESCRIFKENHPDWEWDTTKHRDPPNLSTPEAFKSKLIEIRENMRLEKAIPSKSPYAGMGLREILKKQKELKKAQ